MTFQFSNHGVVPTKFCFLFGKNLLTSASEKLHNFWFKKYNFKCEYKNCVLQGTHEFINTLTQLKMNGNFLGGNITMPFKQTLLESFHDAFTISQTVKNTASSNTLFRDENGNLNLENTDVIGIQKTLNSLCPANILFENVLLFGGGGASASCAFTLLNSAIAKRVTCFTRNIAKSTARFQMSKFLDTALKNQTLLFKPLDENFLHTDTPLKNILNTQDALLIINTLPLGKTKMYPASNDYCTFLLKKCVPNRTFYFDLIYEDTDSCKTAKVYGIKYQNGELMFQTQAAYSFQLWTKIYPTINAISY